MFKRKIEATIENYLRGDRGKILVVDGARQVGKTFIIRKLSKLHFPNYIEINLKEDFDGERVFSSENVKTTAQFYYRLSALYGNLLKGRDDTLVFLDEIQVYPHLLTMLKPLNQEKRFTYIASGSLLGVALKHTFIPMGSIDEEKMYPLDFEEFLWASNVGADLIERAKDCFANLKPLEDFDHVFLLNKFKEYLLCGGLPDAVKEFVISKNIYEMRRIHSSTYRYYKDDASKYDAEHRLKIARIYDLMTSFMENKVKRIQGNKISSAHYGLDHYEDEFDYLISSGIALPVKAVSNPKFPLSESIAKNLIKLYYNDVGLLTYILYQNNIDAVLKKDKGVNLGSVYETAAAMELTAHHHDLYYFNSKKSGEVDFLINDYDRLAVLPIEIKSGNDQNNYRALPKLVDPQYGYNLPLGYVFGNKNIIKKEGKIVTLPIYMIMFL